MCKNTDPFTGDGANNAAGGPFSGTSVARQYQALLGLVQTTRFTGVDLRGNGELMACKKDFAARNKAQSAAAFLKGIRCGGYVKSANQS